MRYIRADINTASADSASKIPKEIREACFMKFKDIVGFDIPDICGQVEHTRIYMPLAAK
jgi:hypothetical protein